VRNFDLDHPLIEFKSTVTIDDKNTVGSSYWTIRNAVEGVQIFGGIGSGKTSGSGRFIALKYLKNGFGGLVLTAKADEKDAWVKYAELTGRSKDLIIFGPHDKNYFNFMQYESLKSNGQQELTANLVQVIKTVIKAGEQKDKGKSDDPFWENTLDFLIYNSIDLCQLAYGMVDLKLLYDLAQTAPRKEEIDKYWRLDTIAKSNIDSPEKSKAKMELDTLSRKGFWTAITKAKEKGDIRAKEWGAQKSQKELTDLRDQGLLKSAIHEDIPENKLLDSVTQFFMESFASLSEKPRSIIELSFSSFIFRLLKEPVYSLFSKNPSSFTPEDCLNGKIIIMDIPVKQYYKVGRDCQIMFKYIWQRAMERRDIAKNDRPVFLWADEAQNFIHEYDSEYQATARSSRIATVYLSQNLSNYYANMGGLNPEHRVKSFLGTLNTKFFHSNADVETNNYASEIIGDDYYLKETRTETVSGEFSSSKAISLELRRIIRPEQFVSLKTGGPKNKYASTAVMHKLGDPMEGKRNYHIRSFNQNYIP